MTTAGLPSRLEDFRGIHDGETFVVCGCGSSLSSFVRPERFHTIGVNDVGRLFQPEYLVVVNRPQQFRGDRYRFVEESGARAIFTQLKLDLPHQHVVPFRLGQRGGVAVSDPGALPYTRNSPYVAMALAMHMGARRIGVIGVDFTDHHFFAATGRHPLTRELTRIDAEYRRLYEECRRLGIEVFNLSGESRLTAFPRLSLEELADRARPSLRIVSYATSPVAGVPPILSRSIRARTQHECRTVWATDGYRNGVRFDGDVEYVRAPTEGRALLEAADVVIVHNGKVAPQHAPLIDGKPVVTLAHNYLWNVDQRFVTKGFPGLVVAQYQATLPEFAGWTAVPNPLPWWEPAFQPEAKSGPVTIAFTPSGRHERYEPGHRLYWHAKGYATTMAVLDRLAARHEVRIDAIRGRQITHAAALAAKRRAHIVIDECVTGSYHRNSLEGLAAGCVVVNGIGILPAVADVLRDVSETSEIPFTPATLDDLEEVLELLIAGGAAEMVATGDRNRRWLEGHWRFERQWTRFWEPAIDRAMSLARPAVARAPRPRPVIEVCAEEQGPSDATIVIPFGGAHRLRNLRLTLGRVAEANVAESVIVVEMDDVPHARELVTAAGARYAFVQQDGGFHKARAMNVAIPLIETGRFFWLDGDLLVDHRFLRRALDELEERQLDCLVPWTTCRYLSEEDTSAVDASTKRLEECVPVNVYSTRSSARGGVVLVRTALARQYGGVCEEFRGWGGEDNAWFMKAAILGRAAPTRHHDQHVHHAWHPLSGGYGPAAAIASNASYQRNLDLLYSMRRLRTREQFLARFPVPALYAAPWYGVRRVACERGAEALYAALVELYGHGVELCALDDSPDAVIPAAPMGADARKAAIAFALELALIPCPPAATVGYLGQAWQ
ncbi:MAG: galactosyltransferase-related protein [Acidobacteriota bacterium]